ncbi:MAG: FliH/SctL family protein [Candidatus Sulfotelmatobacter sp.]|jgi:flagellar assembly protein FliH
MSSSASRAALSPASPTPVPGEPPAVLPFSYSIAVAEPGKPNFLLSEHRLASPGELDPAAGAAPGLEREAQVRELGRQQGGLECRAKFEEQLARERSAVAQALADFARERAAYYKKIEAEAVQLALSIARKVLHREAQVDPLLLMGILRVALERIEGATGVVLAVNPQQAPVWRNYLISRLGPGELPQVVEDPTMALEQCQLRTSMGTAELGLEVQLKEIEQGLTDLLAARPQIKDKP